MVLYTTEGPEDDYSQSKHVAPYTTLYLQNKLVVLDGN
jgi:hypothetical protein